MIATINTKKRGWLTGLLILIGCTAAQSFIGSQAFHLPTHAYSHQAGYTNYQYGNQYPRQSYQSKKQYWIKIVISVILFALLSGIFYYLYKTEKLATVLEDIAIGVGVNVLAQFLFRLLW
ncbi:MAG: hypothetical protein AAF770_03500 [Bacteroidota bacterium]